MEYFFGYNYCDFVEFNFGNNETEFPFFFETENHWPYGYRYPLRAPMCDIELVALDLHIWVANRLVQCTTYTQGSR